ncbi:MAG TPA: TadE family protein [Caulobacteraceae bacterium]|nr:TadE family protein [Caulobacteraceae bacterium]
MAVEFAIIAPMMIVILAGIYEIGHAFQAMTAANALASQYAISWADCQDNPTGTCLTEMGLYTPTDSIANLEPQLTASSVNVEMFQVSMTGTTPVVTYAYPLATPLTASQITAAQTSLQNGQTGVIVTVNYTYTVSIFPSAIGNLIPTSIPMSYTVVQLKD